MNTKFVFIGYYWIVLVLDIMILYPLYSLLLMERDDNESLNADNVLIKEYYEYRELET